MASIGLPRVCVAREWRVAYPGQTGSQNQTPAGLVALAAWNFSLKSTVCCRSAATRRGVTTGQQGTLAGRKRAPSLHHMPQS